MADAPKIEVHIIQSTEDPGGVGERGTSGVIAAVANAVFAATESVFGRCDRPAQLRVRDAPPYVLWWSLRSASSPPLLKI